MSPIASLAHGEFPRHAPSMDNEEIRKLFEELEGKVELGMGEEALAICATILSEAGEIDVNEFGDLCRAIGMFSDDMPAWRERLAVRFSALGEWGGGLGAFYWVPFLAAADAAWEDIKPHVNLRQLDSDSILLACRSAIEARDAEWCHEALPLIERLTLHPSAECSHALAYAALLAFMENHLGALEAMQGFKIQEKWFETYLELLTKSTTAHFLKSLKRLTEQIQVLGDDPNIERQLPGNDQGRFDDLMESIAKAEAAVMPLTEI